MNKEQAFTCPAEKSKCDCLACPIELSEDCPDKGNPRSVAKAAQREKKKTKANSQVHPRVRSEVFALSTAQVNRVTFTLLFYP